MTVTKIEIKQEYDAQLWSKCASLNFLKFSFYLITRLSPGVGFQGIH